MSKLVTKGNLALFEYPSGSENPSFTLEKDGVLWIEGYSIPFTPNGTPVRAMKRYETKLKNYKVIGRYSDAKSKIKGDFSSLAKEGNIDTENCVVLFRNLSLVKD